MGRPTNDQPTDWNDWNGDDQGEKEEENREQGEQGERERTGEWKVESWKLKVGEPRRRSWSNDRMQRQQQQQQKTAKAVTPAHNTHAHATFNL